MKKLSNLLCIALLGVFTLTSCNNNNDDFQNDTEAALKADKALDSLFSAEAVKIKAYINASTDFKDAVEDTITVRFQYLQKTIKRGLWYKVINPATSDAYEYKGQIVNYNGFPYFVPTLPKVKLKYTAKLLDGTVVQKDVDGSTYDLNTMSQSNMPPTVYNNAWRYSFLPYLIKYNGKDEIVGGLTAKGLKKGNKFKVITPSFWAFGNRKVGDIPTNSPLVYEFEVLEIE